MELSDRSRVPSRVHDLQSHSCNRRGPMSMTRFSSVCLASLICSMALLAQTASVNAASGASNSTDEGQSATKLERFDPNLVDKTLDPCNDFYKYSCSKWLAANPMPADQVFWGTGSGLELWNENLLRETLQAAATASNRSATQQKIGDYWAACMDESGIEAAGLKPLQPELDRIA